jgi:hypothetical protein
MTKDNSSALETFADNSRYPHIPQALVTHARLCITQSTESRLVDDLLIDAEKTSQAFDRLFDQASKITGLSPSDLLSATGFSPRDLDTARLESALAEIRTIIFLNAQSFQDILPLRAKHTRMADFVARRGNEKYAVEVADSTYNATKRFSIEQLAGWVVSRYQKEGKASQLEYTVSAEHCRRKVFVAIINTRLTAALQTHREFYEAAQRAWIAVGPDTTLHICVVTGKETFGYGPDDAVFPPGGITIIV